MTTIACRHPEVGAFCFKAMLLGLVLLLSNQALAANIVLNADLLTIDTYSGNNNNPKGMSAIKQALNLPEDRDLRAYKIGESGSSGGSDNGLAIKASDFKEGNEPIAGDWWFDPAESTFSTIDYLVVKAGKQYSLYKVNYPDDVFAGDSIHGAWSTFGMGKHAMSHITAYSVIHTPIPFAGLLFASALVSTALLKSRFKTLT